MKQILLIALFLLPISGIVMAQNDTAKKHTAKHHKTTQKAGKEPAKEVKQTPAKRKELLKRTLKEKNFHIPDTNKHK